MPNETPAPAPALQAKINVSNRYSKTPLRTKKIIGAIKLAKIAMPIINNAHEKKINIKTLRNLHVYFSFFILSFHPSFNSCPYNCPSHTATHNPRCFSSNGGYTFRYNFSVIFSPLLLCRRSGLTSDWRAPRLGSGR
jgi:hypothetical protein